MNFGLKKTLLALAASVAGISSSYAAAPVIKPLPDITIGDAEDNIGTDSNLFIFTGSFVFDDRVSDNDTTVSDLLWSFDEGDATTVQWYTVNGKNPVAVGDAAAATADHLLPDAAHELRAAGATADWRDIVFSGTSGSGPFSAPTDPDKTDHANGKVVTFYVSDQTNVTSDSIIVKTVDNASDYASEQNVWVPKEPLEPFSTEVADAWQKSGADQPGLISLSYDATNQALAATVVATNSNNKVLGWLEKNSADDIAANAAKHLSYADLGDASNFIRAKFGLFATGQTNSSDKNQIPNFRIRVMSRFGYCDILDVLHHPNDNPGIVPISTDLTPSTDPTKPSVYRVDLDPMEDLPYYGSNPTEGFQRYYECYSLKSDPQHNGNLELAESAIGVYPALDLGDNSKVIKTYASTADFQQSALITKAQQLQRGSTALQNETYYIGTSLQSSSVPAVPSGQVAMTSNPGGVAGITLSTATSPDTVIAIAAVDWLTGAAEDSNPALRARVEPGKQYALRYYVTASGASSDNAQIRLRSRTVQFSYTHRLELGGPWNLLAHTQSKTDSAQINRASHVIARQALPGTGGRGNGSEQTYDLLMVTPFQDSIRADVTGDTATKFPNLSAQAGPGSSTASSRRDLLPGLDLIDSLDNDYWFAGTSDPGEKGNYTVNKIEIRSYDLVPD